MARLASVPDFRERAFIHAILRVDKMFETARYFRAPDFRPAVAEFSLFGRLFRMPLLRSTCSSSLAQGAGYLRSSLFAAKPQTLSQVGVNMLIRRTRCRASDAAGTHSV
jgi:hypothetical protein